jgi:cell division septum initiation protein DivIVA
MKKSDLLQRIEELERRVAELEARPAQVQIVEVEKKVPYSPSTPQWPNPYLPTYPDPLITWSDSGGNHIKQALSGLTWT